MIETLAISSPPSLCVSPRSSPSDCSMDSNPKLHQSHSHLNAFGTSDSPRSSCYHADSSLSPPGSDNHLQVSPRTVPLSFHNLTCHEKDTAPTSISPSKSYGYAVLTIRKSSLYPNTNSSSLSREPSHGSFGLYMPGTSPIHHRRRPSTELSLSPSNLRFARSEPPCPQHSPTGHVRGEINESLYSSNNSSAENMSPHSVEDLLFPGGLEMGSVSSGVSGDEICPRHHHRQSVSSTVSIPCSNRDDDEVLGHMDHFEGEIETSIAMEPIAPSMLVPLVDRSDEMSELLKHPANESWIHLVQNTIGRDVYENKCISLWTKTDRDQMSDSEWLKMSKKLLSKKGCGGICDNRLWHEFCGMVGWDSGSVIFEDEDDYEESSMRRPSREGLVLSGEMGSIAEELEEEEVGGLRNPVAVSTHSDLEEYS
ncbi:hypothetical protein K440DRAFT_633653 [Wilcoxina mikolae CBS 423.85]|nr:hypothetical protein K440DRAFT_633653 [Wilcoxina mikolae CBS 423.85]